MMAGRNYRQSVSASRTRFTQAPMSEVEFSKMSNVTNVTTTFNAGRIVPIFYQEILPHDTFTVDVESIIRQTTSKFPVMGELIMDIDAVWVPNRIINDSWKNVQGENTSGYWAAPQVDLAPLASYSMVTDANNDSIQVPVGSVADYYGFPTQLPIPITILEQCNDLKFRGYLMAFNKLYRSENYQPPIPFSTLNVFNGFMEPVGTMVSLGDINIEGADGTASSDSLVLSPETPLSADGSYPLGAYTKSVYGEGANPKSSMPTYISGRLTSWSALGEPLRANKLHDVFTSALPAPQKGQEVYFGIGDISPIIADGDPINKLGQPLALAFTGNDTSPSALGVLADGTVQKLNIDASAEFSGLYVTGTNLYADLSRASGISVNDLRTSIATQQVLEILARGGSRYNEMIASFFGIDTDNPFSDVPVLLGRVRNNLDLFQVAQTAPTEDTSVGNLSAFGYTDKGGKLFYKTFLEHGYVHFFVIIRQKNVYSSYFSPDNFRMSTMDFYLPPLANISEQPIRKAILHPFSEDSMDAVLGYQEAWWEYRNEPDRTSGYMRSGIKDSLEVWTYADIFDPNFTHINGDWLYSNAQEVVDKTVVTTSEITHQFLGQFFFKITKQRPMPVYSVPGLDMI